MIGALILKFPLWQKYKYKKLYYIVIIVNFLMLFSFISDKICLKLNN